MLATVLLVVGVAELLLAITIYTDAVDGAIAPWTQRLLHASVPALVMASAGIALVRVGRSSRRWTVPALLLLSLAACLAFVPLDVALLG